MSNSLPTLFKFRANNIIYWQIIYDINNISYFTKHGYCRIDDNDNIEYNSEVITEPSTVEGKNIGKRNYISPPEQLVLVANRLHVAKLKEGYKPFDVFTNNDIHSDKFEVARANEFLMKSFVRQVSIDYNKGIDKYYIQAKLDGVRCYIKDGIAYSRNHNILEGIKFNLNYKNVIFDGELYKHGRDFSEIVSDVKRGIMDNIELHLFDVYFPKLPLICYDERIDFLSRIDLSNHHSNNIVIVKTKQLELELNENIILENISHYNNLAIKKGYEGIMIKLNRLYKFGKSTNMFKYKDFLDREFEIIDFEEGNGNSSKLAATAVIKITYSKDDLKQYPYLKLIKGDVYTKATITGSVKQREEYLAHKNQYIGKMATVRFQGYFEDTGVLRFPRLIIIRDYE